MKVNKFGRVLGLLASMALLHSVGLHAAQPQHDNGNGSDFVAFNVNDARLSDGYVGSGQDLREITAVLDKVFADSQPRPQRVVITGYASPDGSYAVNRKLARQRTLSLKDYVMRRYNLSEDMIVTQSVAEDWKGLEEFVAKASLQDLPHRDAMLKIIRSNRKADRKERALRSQYPQDFLYLKEHCLPQLRRSEYHVEYATGVNANLSETDLMGVSQTTEVNTGSEATVAVADTLLNDITSQNDVESSVDESFARPAAGTLSEPESDSAGEPANESADRSSALSYVGTDDVNAQTEDNVTTMSVDSQADGSQIVPSDKVIVSETITHDSINGDAQVRFIINEFSLRPEYRGNETDLDKIRASMEKMMAYKNASLRSITIHGYASPDGSYKFNEKLAYNRANILRTMVAECCNLPLDIIRVESTAEDWYGLERLVEQTP